MTKDVLIRIHGIQLADGSQDNLEMITSGSYYKKNEKHYIVYEEVLEGYKGTVKNVIRIQSDCMDIIKTGVTNVHMVFEQDKKRISCYSTPLGEFMVGLTTKTIVLDEEEDKINAKVNYSLELNHEHVSECNIQVEVQSRSQAQVNLRS